MPNPDTLHNARLDERYRMAEWLEERATEIDVRAHQVGSIALLAQAAALREAAAEMRKL